MKQRQANQQDVPIDILTTSSLTQHTDTQKQLLYPRELQDGAEEATRSFEEWIGEDGDGDEDEAFCLAPELDEVPYQGEVQVVESNGRNQ